MKKFLTLVLIIILVGAVWYFTRPGDITDIVDTISETITTEEVVEEPAEEVEKEIQAIQFKKDIVSENGEIVAPIRMQDTGKQYAGFTFDISKVPAEVTDVEVELVGILEAWTINTAMDIKFDEEARLVKVRVSGNAVTPYITTDGSYIMNIILKHTEALSSNAILLSGTAINDKFESEKLTPRDILIKE